MTSSEIDKLERALAALEAQRPSLGDDVVEAALLPLRERLTFLRAAERPSAAVETQRRRMVTILFADVSGYTAMSENLDAEDVRDTMNALWQSLDAVILAHGGKIDKHMGDGVMALWGADEAREDDPQRAISAALAMQAALAEFRPSVPLAQALKMRIGINTGPVLLGSIGARGEMTALGDSVNVAARLEQLCPAGQVLISHDSYRHVRGVFKVEAQPPQMLKGKSEAVQSYSVLALKPRAFRLYTRGIEGVETPMIGRDAQLAALQDIFHIAFLHPSLQVVTITGEAGIGKSRLMHEFNAWAEIQSISWWVFKARASLSLQNTPYALLRDIFSFRFEIQESDSLALAHQKMEAGFREFMRGDADAVKKAHIIGHLIGFDFSHSPHLQNLLNDPRQLRQLALFYLIQFFHTVTAQSPALLMVDDLQWADNGSLEVISYLLANLPADAPFMLLALARPTLYERIPHWGLNLPGHSTAIALTPLPKADSRRLVDELLCKVSDLPDAIRELVVGGAEGNPFYLEELIKMLIDQRVIRPGEEQWTVETDRLASVTIPATLTEVLQARLDGLSATERLVLQRASVVGRVFWAQGLLAMSPDLAEADLLNALESLRRKELIFQHHSSSFSGTQEFTFKHSLLLEVAYETLLKRQRASLHSLAAAWLNQISGERRGEYLAQIADHYEKGGDYARAAEALSRAAERALELSALVEARNFFQRALTLLDQPDHSVRDVIQMKIGLADACIQLGDYEQAQVHAENAAAMAGDLQIDLLVADALTELGQIASYTGRYDDAKSYLVGALFLARQEQAQSSVAKILAALAGVEWRLGELNEARQHAQEAQAAAAELGDTHTLLQALNRLGVLAGALGQPEEEIRYYQQALDLALSVGNRERAATALNNLGAQAGEASDWQRAREYYQRALETSRETGARQGEALHLINLGLACTQLREEEQARAYLLEGMRLALKLGAAPVVVSGVTYLALLEYNLGNVLPALEMLGAARNHPAWDSEGERELDVYFTPWKVSPAERAQAFERGARIDWDELLHTKLLHSAP
ncbi:MAG: adenylate/guanylate cyclase domain-containing protein [Anaerolineales bacterium]